jgi:hypothetical protein
MEGSLMLHMAHLLRALNNRLPVLFFMERGDVVIRGVISFVSNDQF